jgi:hypothetical protein
VYRSGGGAAVRLRVTDGAASAWSTCCRSELRVEILDDLPIQGHSLTRRGGDPLSGAAFMVKVRRRSSTMELITILNRCHRFRVLSTSTPTSVPTRRVSK